MSLLVFIFWISMKPVKAEEVLTVREALWKILQSLEVTSLVEGLAALVFCSIIGIIVFKIQQEAKSTLKIVHNLAADGVQLRERLRR